MHHPRTGRPARRGAALGGTALLFVIGALALSLPSAGATAGRRGADAAGVTVRIEGPHSTLLEATTVRLAAGSFSKDGVAADRCSDASAAGALEAATHGNWKGTWSKSLKGYFVSGIDGVSLPSSGGAYWAFWIDDAPASAGICGIDPKAGQRILFFPDCYGKTCPKNDGVLGIAAPAVAHAGKPFAVTVTAYADANGKPRPAVGATVSGGGASATTGSGGRAHLTVARGGRVTLEVSAPHAIRTEASVCVERAGMTGCG